ncbi:MULTISPECIES: hypothetical protein [unclassified Myroides]|uniref:hypothetical protein n=1 Tax=unclassified Myroides TaxID=2642485 RepID=UPI003D2F5315
MKKFICFVSACFVVTACTIDKTDYESETNTSVPDNHEFKTIISFEQGSYSIQMEALDGQLYKGYNEVRLHVMQKSTKEVVEDAVITFLPVHTTATGEKETCPHSNQFKYQSQERFYQGYSVFTTESTTGNWEVILSLAIEREKFEQVETVTVRPQGNMNLNMTSFIGSDQEHYIIALVAPNKPKVAENQLVAGIFKKNNLDTTTQDLAALQQAYSSVDGYKLFLDPRMPEPSMGNHSSPNNKDLIQGEDALYYGVVNYTMTGNWTLNFILQNDKGRLIKGTKVPTDFTPGVAGVKSELFIDILF